MGFKTFKSHISFLPAETMSQVAKSTGGVMLSKAKHLVFTAYYKIKILRLRLGRHYDTILRRGRGLLRTRSGMQEEV
jgi:hypothetical protein